MANLQTDIEDIHELTAELNVARGVKKAAEAAKEKLESELANTKSGIRDKCIQMANLQTDIEDIHELTAELNVARDAKKAADAELANWDRINVTKNSMIAELEAKCREQSIQIANIRILLSILDELTAELDMARGEADRLSQICHERDAHIATLMTNWK